MTLRVRVGGMPQPKTGATHFHTQLGFLDKELVAYWVLLNTMGD